MKKSLIVAGAASVALAAMPVVGVFATDDTDVTDTIEVTVTPSCTFRASGDGTLDATYAAEGVNGASVNPSVSGGNNVHTFNIFCNNNKGYTVSATAHDLAAATATPAITDTFAYKAALSATAGTQGEWHAEFAATTSGVTAASLPNSTDGTSTGTIITRSNTTTAAAGDTWTATYTALIGTETKATTYSGTIVYTLSATN